MARKTFAHPLRSLKFKLGRQFKNVHGLFTFDHCLLLIGITVVDNHGTKLTNKKIYVVRQQRSNLFDYI